MIIGDPALFAIESSLTSAYARLSLRGLGFFVLHIGGLMYGVREDDATLLAASFDAVGDRLRDRGLHTATFAENTEAGILAAEFRQALYGDEAKPNILGMPAEDFTACFTQGKSRMWAPDGDAAFDDGSYVLQFDAGSRVRLVAFKSEGSSYAPQTLRDIWLEDWRFYDVLQRWHDAFEREWTGMAKSAE